MKILLSAYACEPNKGSEPGVGWNWALALVRRGHQVWVITRKNNQQPIEQAMDGLGEPYLTNLHFIYYDTPNWILRFKKSGLGVHLYYALWQKGILEVAKKNHQLHKFDLVQHLTFGAWRQPTQLYKLDIPCIFGPVGGGETAPWALVHGMPGLKSKLSEYLRYLVNRLSLFNPSLQKCLKRSALVVAKTKETAHWIKNIGVNSLVSLEIGINTDRINTVKLPTVADKLRCVYAGRLIGWKGVHLALAAVAEAQTKGTDVSLTIVGNGPLLDDLKKKAISLGISKKISFTGQLNQAELFAKYQQHDVLLFPSLHDSSGNVVLESFAQSLPVICLNLGGPAVMVDESCGRAIDVQTATQAQVVAKLADTLIEFVKNPELIQTMRLAAKIKACESTWDAAVERVYFSVEHSLGVK